MQTLGRSVGRSVVDRLAFDGEVVVAVVVLLLRLLLLLLQPVVVVLLLVVVAGMEQIAWGCYRGGNLSNIALTTRT